MEEWVCATVVACTLFFFMVVAFMAMYIFPIRSTGDFVGANNSQSVWYLALTFYASSFGASLLFAVPEVGSMTGILGSIGYTVGASLPFLLIALLGIQIRRSAHLQENQAATFTDFLPNRIGHLMQAQISLISLFMMVIFIAAELTAVGDVVEMLSPGADRTYYVAGVSIVTLLYTCYGGFGASLLTDRFQGVIILVFTVMVIAACLGEVSISEDEWDDSGVLDATSLGGEAAVTLTIAITASVMFHQGFWQRALSAESDRTLILGCSLAALLVGITTMLFSVVGMVAKANNPDIIDALAFFELLTMLPGQFWEILSLLLAVSLVCGGVDTLQNGIASIVAGDLLSRIPVPHSIATRAETMYNKLSHMLSPSPSPSPSSTSSSREKSMLSCHYWSSFICCFRVNNIQLEEHITHSSSGDNDISKIAMESVHERRVPQHHGQEEGATSVNEGADPSSTSTPLKLVVGRVLTVVLNLPAVWLALGSVSVLDLYMIADLLTCTSVMPLLFGLLWDGTHEKAAFISCYVGLFALLIQGWIVLGTPEEHEDSQHSAFYHFINGFRMLALPGGMYQTRATVAFVITTLSSAISTVVLSLCFSKLGANMNRDLVPAWYYALVYKEPISRTTSDNYL